MDISKLRNYLGHDCFFNVTTDSGQKAIYFKYSGDHNLFEICLVNKDNEIYHTVLQIDGNDTNNSKSYPLINGFDASIIQDTVRNTIRIVPTSISNYGDWEIYLRVFGDTQLELPPKKTLDTSGDVINSYVYLSTSNINMGNTWYIYEDSGKNLIFKHIPN